MRPNPKVILPAIAVVAVAIAGWWYFGPKQVSADVGQLSASGTIEATEVTVASELSGRVAEVLVAEGDPVKLGQALVRFDDSLLQAQLNNAKASLALAQANYNLVSAGATTEQRQSAISAAQLEVISAQQAVDALSDHANLATARAEQAVAAADKALDLATQKLDNLGSSAEQVDIDSAQATVVLLQDQLDKARKAFDPYQNKAEDNLARAMLQNKLAGAQKKYDAAVNRLNNLLGTANSYELNLAKADKTAAEAQLADARLQYDKVKDGPDPDSLALAEQRLQTAQAHLAAAKAEPTAEQLAVAQAQVNLAQSALAVLETQMDKLVLIAPADGSVVARSVEPGETALPGASLLTISRLDQLNITVYVPEDRYGAISLGQAAQVKVDSFPGVFFPSSVIHIADQAEFTPRNVQTAEGRRTTVFAVKLSVDDPQGRLKPGMPADVSFAK